MKTKLFFIIASFIFLVDVNAQNTFPSSGAAGIGTTSPAASSLLEVKSTTKGILIPRMTATQKNAITSPATGLLIYQTNSTPGFYYYNGSAWTAVTQKSKGWSLTGNSGTTSSNFLGTTDAHAFTIKVNNQRSGYIDYDVSLENTGFGYQVLGSNAGGSNSAFGYRAYFSGTSGYQNTAIGTIALYSNTTGGYNVAVGLASLFTNTGGFSNTSVGQRSMYLNSTGGNNTAIGFNSLYSNTTGNYNIASGNLAGYDNTTGSNNIFIGQYAGIGKSTGDGNICIGQSTTVSNGVSNSIVIGNSLSAPNNNSVILGGSAQNVGIGTTTPLNNSQLTVNGGSKYYSIYAEDHYAGSGGGITIYSTNDKGGGWGMYGESTGSTSNDVNIGVFGYANGSTYDVATGSGSQWASIANYGIYGDAGSSGGLAGLFNGDVISNGNIYSGSDVKLKKNIQPLNNALVRLKQVQVKEFDFNEDYAKQNSLNLPNQHQFGFIAQDVTKTFPNLVTSVVAPIIDHSQKGGKVTIKGSSNFLAVNYISFIPLLTKGIQELSSQNDSLKETNQALQSDNALLHQQLNEISSKIEQIETAMSQCCSSFSSNMLTIINSQSQTKILSSASLSQNIPNPFSNSTTISYSLPKQFSSAKIIVTDKSGKALKEINISAGKGSINVDASTLASGAYQYSLYVDGKRIDTKQMILAK